MWWHKLTHGMGSEGESWWMDLLASTFHTTFEHVVSNIITAEAHTSAADSRLNWRTLVDLIGIVRFAGRRNMVSARVPLD